MIKNDKLSINKKEKDNLKDIEKNFVSSSLNKKSTRTQFKKERQQKLMQQSDKAEISKVNSESDNVTEFDNKIKLLVKFRYDNGQSIKGDINEKEELENELIDNEKDMITVLNNNNKNFNEFKEEKLIYNKDTLTMKKNNYLNNLIEKNEKFEVINNDNNNSEEKKENNKINLIDISKDNKISNEGLIGNDNISENKKLMPMIPNIVKANNLGDINNKEKKQNKKINTISIIKKQIQKKVENSNLSNSSNRELLKNNKAIFRSMQLIQKNCFICEREFYLSKLYCANCGIHSICRRCLKSYYEDYIENKNNSKILKCPNTLCDKTINYEILKTIISERHQQIYEKEKDEKKDLIYNKNEIKHNDNNIKIYSEKHVLDICSNMKFFMFKKKENIFCPKCLNPNLFSKTNTHFIKCLNCNYKVCKYCLKEFTEKHLDIKVGGYCKIYFRKDIEDYGQNNQFLFYLLQLLFVIAMYLLAYCGTYLFFYEIFKIKFRLNSHKKNFYYYIKKVIIITFSIILFIISCPFIFVCFPFFPVIIALFDF